MSDASSFDFSKFVPGFDFLKNLSSSGAQPGMPSASAWIAPTLDPDELDKRIQELKTVHFWLDQNTKAVSATIQALEVQKMTLATLRGMNMSMADLAESLKVKPDTLSSVFKGAGARSATAGTMTPNDHASTAVPPEGKPKTRAPKKPRQTASSAQVNAAASSAGSPAGGVDPMAWWGSLTQQFQQIANQAVQDLQRQPPAAAGTEAQARTSASPRAASSQAKRAPKGASASSSSKSKPARKSAPSATRHKDA